MVAIAIDVHRIAFLRISVGFNRYFVPNLPQSGSIELPSDEAHHALRVRRETVGSKCVAFDGRGYVAICNIVRVSKRDIAIEIESYAFEPNEPPGHIQLAVAMPKGDRQKAVIEKAVELGVHELVPLICRRSVSLPSDSAAEKWHRTVVEACKQCERNRLMSIGPSLSFESLIQSAVPGDSTKINSSLKMIAHPQRNTTVRDGTIRSPYDPVSERYPQVTIAIGPEGGFTNEEVQSAIEAGWSQLDFGPRILRVETAVCVASLYANLCNA